MGRSYSQSLQVRVVAFVEAGHSRCAAARHFGFSDRCSIKLMRHQAQSGSPAPARQGRPRGRGKHETCLVQTVDAKPAITRPEWAARLLSRPGVQVDPATLSRLLCRQGLTDQKVHAGRGVRTRRHSR
ncbi:transposase [Microvirga massiliensis]|uniref:transposase n=1 Tax=Microvirga massiliensis TaxID=1033741 RepID=UPI00062BCDD2|nr:transposase [Microvirga massiliensis]